MQLRRASVRVALTENRYADAIVLSGFGRPFGLGQDGEGNLLVTDMDLHAVCRFSHDLSHVTLIGTGERDRTYTVEEGTSAPAAPRPPDRLNGPHAVDVASDGRLYVTTYYTPAIHVFDMRGTPLGEIGIDQTRMALQGPATAFFDGSGRLLVAEYRMNVILAVAPGGDYLGGLGWCGGRAARFERASSFSASSEPGGFDRPHMCRQSPDGFLVVADTWNHRLQRFAPDGSWAGWFGADGGEAGGSWHKTHTPARSSAAPGGFNAPVAVGWSAAGQMVVTDWGNNRLQIFNPEDNDTLALDGLGLDRPYDAQFLGDRLCVADSHNGRVLLLKCSDLFH